MKRNRPKSTKNVFKLGQTPSPGTVYNRIPEAIYEVECVGLEIKNYRGTQKLFVYFKHVDGPLAGEWLPKYFNFGWDEVPYSSDYFGAWIIAAGKAPYSRSKKDMPARMLLNKRFKASVETTKSKFRSGAVKPDVAQHSRIAEVLSLVDSNHGSGVRALIRNR